jgi:DNA polymerase-3 subunit epsilon
MDFVVVDVETANPDLASICQVGVARFEDGRCVEQWERLVDPRDEFHWAHVKVHGIRPGDVAGSPTIAELYPELEGLLGVPVVASHTAFDRAAVCRAAARHALAEPGCAWLDTARAARVAWPRLGRGSYGLKSLGDRFGIRFVHHHAGEDARAAGEVLLRAIDETGLGVEQLLARARAVLFGGGARIVEAGAVDGPLAGEVIVFTGALSMKRKKASELAAQAGCDVADAVTPATTLLVVGDQDLRKLAGHEKSSKHRRAEELVGGGFPIRILQESDFLGLIALK